MSLFGNGEWDFLPGMMKCAPQKLGQGMWKYKQVHKLHHRN